MINLRNIKLLTFLFLIQFCCTKNVKADIDNKIVAVIGSDLITKHDLESKINMIAFLNNKDASIILNDDNLKKDIINGLIDEILIMSQAKKLGITVSEEEFARALIKLLSSTHITEAQLIKTISNGVFEKNTLSNFIKYQVSMGELVKNKLQKEIQYSTLEKTNFEKELRAKSLEENTEYKIFIVNAKTINLVNQDFGTCTKLNNFLLKNHLPVNSSHSVVAKDMNKELFQKIKSVKEKNGLVKYHENFVGFCSFSNSVASTRKEDMNNSFQNELIKKAVQKNFQELRENTFVLIKS